MGEDVAMAKEIGELLHRRSDLSTYLVHLTKSYEGKSPLDNLVSIMDSKCLQARTAYGMGAGFEDEADFLETQKVVCFSETPLEHVWMMCEEIVGRDLSLGPCGLAVSKVWGRRHGVNPVWYIDITTGHDWLTVPIDRLADKALADGKRGGTPFKNSDIALVLPFLEQMGKPLSIRKEFWWEREWRHVGPLFLPWPSVVALFAPEEDHETLRQRLQHNPTSQIKLPPVLDATWGLERMIAALRELPAADIGPFP
jgi:hypothetical protein